MKKKRKLIIKLSIFLIFIFWMIYGNVVVDLNVITIYDNKIPQEFDGYKVAHISDLHNDISKSKQLIKLLKKSNPNVIAITGDIIDSNNTNISGALDFVEEIVKIAPCYYVTGNHEAWIGNYDYLKEQLLKLGIIVLEDMAVEINVSGKKIKLIGVNDPSFSSNVKTKLERLSDDELYSILLSHRPELFDIYVECNINLVLSGHAHGGQVRIPFIGGLGAPDQGLFPKYDSGLYTLDNTKMIVSRGVGNSIIPIRFNNQPEMILIELKTLDD